MAQPNPIPRSVVAGPFKLALAAGAGAGLALGVRQVFGGKSFWVATAAVACVAILWSLGRTFLAWRRAATGKPLAGKIAAGFRLAGGEAKDSGERARIDALRAKFEAGVARFREAGKDLYSLPWYLLVGEPGSGKSEAIRHAQLPFPPGLNEPMQGAGGTVSMDWWFTNRGIILDTAGRYVMGHARPADWKELLSLLRRHRPHCPINGLVLAIPADSLVRDNADVIQHKAERLAEELQQIQNALDVRFPVFILVTKSDKIYGFREFFDVVDDPQVQHSILGWSYADELDAAFDPKSVERELASLRRRLEARRAGMMLDPAHTLFPEHGRRIDELDAMYAFPESIAKVGSRLRWYLQSIFVSGAFSGKPLFLRGVYFTSSMRTGDALDEDLAAALGIGVDDLPEGKVFEQERAFFLRDLFMDKVFKERGLVSHASQARREHRARRRRGLAAAAVVVLGMIALTIFSSWWQSNAVEARKQRWEALALALQAEPSRAFGPDGYRPVILPLDHGSLPLPALLAEESSPKAAIAVAPAFRPAAGVIGRFASARDPEAARLDALRAIGEARLIAPMLEQVALQLDAFAALDPTLGAHGMARRTIALLAQWRRAGLERASEPPGLEPLAVFLLAGNEASLRAYEADREALLLAFAHAYADGAWTHASARLAPNLREAIARGTRSQADSLETWARAQGGAAPAAAMLRSALAAYESAEAANATRATGGDRALATLATPLTSTDSPGRVIEAIHLLTTALNEPIALVAESTPDVAAHPEPPRPSPDERSSDIDLARDAALLAQARWAAAPRALPPARYPLAVQAADALDQAQRLSASDPSAAVARFREAAALYARAAESRTEVERLARLALETESQRLERIRTDARDLRSLLDRIASRRAGAHARLTAIGDHPAGPAERAELEVLRLDLDTLDRASAILTRLGVTEAELARIEQDAEAAQRRVAQAEPALDPVPDLAGLASSARAVEPMVSAWVDCDRVRARWERIPAGDRPDESPVALFDQAVALADAASFEEARAEFIRARDLFERAHASWSARALAGARREAEAARERWREVFASLEALGVPPPPVALEAASLLREAEEGGPSAAVVYVRARERFDAAIVWLSDERIRATTPDESGATALHSAAAAGSVPDLRRALALGAGVDDRTRSGATPLSLAVSAGHADAVRSLLQAGANINGLGEGDRPVIFAAVASPEIFSLLVERGANLSTKFLLETLLHAIARVRSTAESVSEDQQIQMATMLLDRGANINALNGSRDTPLDVAEQSGSSRLFALLRARGGTSGR